MTFDANAVVCADIHKASFSLVTADEIRKTAVCRIFSAVAFDGDRPRCGGVHDPRLGPMDGDPRHGENCVTCGGHDDCPGHLGCIDLYLPAYHPLFIPDLIRLLKATCLLCRRLRLSAGQLTVYLKKFQFVQLGELGLLARFESCSSGLQSFRGFDSSSTEKRIELKRVLKELKDKELAAAAGADALYVKDLRVDISQSATSIENWRKVRNDLLLSSAASPCSHCGRSLRCTVRKKEYDSTIEVGWDFSSECPVDRQLLLKTLDPHEEFAALGDPNLPTIRDAGGLAGVDEDVVLKDHRSLGRRGKAVGSAKLQAYQVLPILRDLFNSTDKPLLTFIIPEAAIHGYRFFFLETVPVSANKFRPPAKSVGFENKGADAGAGGGILHPRTNALIQIITENAKVGFALSALRYSTNSRSKLAENEGGLQESVPSHIAWKDPEKLEKSIIEHQGNYSLLHSYCRLLQEKINCYIDSTKSGARNPPPAIRQWMEKKQGAIRQKMMGKRVNFAARTTIAPDAMINTNEIGIPMPFAMKLTIAEYAVPHNVDLLCRLIMNGSKVYPGCNAIVQPSGRRLDLTRRDLSLHQKRLHCRLLREHVEQQVAGGGIHNQKLSNPYAVYRHLRDGDVVVMNRQPSLHRASMMAHFIRVLTGQKTFRLNYANCGSYNADFDGDEMNLHCPQDYTSRAEAAIFINSDCNYTVVKSGEPLRGLIQDHVLGGNFLTVKGTFLTRDQYFNLIYVGVAAFVDKGERFNLSSNKLVSPEFSAGDPFARALGNKNIRIVTDPPAIWKPEPLWTGKQVVTAVMKTLIDSIALIQYGKNPTDGTLNQEFISNYRGINLTSKSKTPGDAWNGILDKDKEEQTVIIRHSELLQGVFDKNQFGASSFGLVHLCFELLGPRVAGTLLSVFQRIFSNFLQTRGFSCSSGDFQMTAAGEETRLDMIRRCTMAGTYLQESFVDAVYQHMHWKENISNTQGARTKYLSVGKTLTNLLTDNDFARNRDQKLKAIREANTKVNESGFVQKREARLQMRPSEVPEFWPADPHRDDKSAVWLTPEQQLLFKESGIIKTDPPMTIDAKAQDVNSAINIRRDRYTPDAIRDWRLAPADRTKKLLMKEVKALRDMGTENPRVRERILHFLTNTPNIAAHFPSAARLLGNEKLWGPGTTISNRVLISTAGRALGIEPPPAPPGRMGPPLANVHHLLPSGVSVKGDGSLRAPELFHPSWAWRGPRDDFDFESPLRYISRILEVNRKQIEGSSDQRLYLMMPSELTRLRMERLIKDYFAGREQIFLTMFDKFFQANMGKLSSRNNDLVAGDVTLYPFPRNGFSSMVTTGAKGSKVNFAMICGMLSQQTLEGKRVPLMISGKTHPAFGAWDLGARAGGLITDRFLTGLRPPDYFFHCMAGREGLVDTAVKTARSGYLQRCVLKSLEGMAVAYDGSVRDSDGSVVQFLYGEDGSDVCRVSYLDNLHDLLANPAIIQARYGSEKKLSNAALKRSLQVVEQAEIGRVANNLPNSEDPASKIFPPTLFPGSVSEWFAETAQAQIASALKKNAILAHDLNKSGILKKRHVKANEIWQKADGSLTTLSRLMRLKYRDALAEPGDAVGCLAAQSMGEPATQMTLNTFHLAGHGAANVTLGIPRLREILQTAGDAATPVLYIPVKGEEKAEYSLNAHKIILGFRTIALTDIINAVGVEANIYWQPKSKLPEGAGNSLYNRGLYDQDVRYGDQRARKFWGYEATIQFENLEHFCKVVPKYTPQKLINYTINRVVKDMMKFANKMMAISATKTADEIWDSEDDELGLAHERFVLERNFRTVFDKKKAQKEMFKAAGFGFGAAIEKIGEDAGDPDLLTGADAGLIYRKGNRKIGKAADDAEGGEAEAADEEDGALPSSGESADDSETDLSDPEGEDAEARPDENEEEVPDTSAGLPPPTDTEGDNSDDSGTDADKIRRLGKRATDEKLSFPTLDKWKYDQRRRCLRRTQNVEDGVLPEVLEDEALWSDGAGAGYRSKTLPDEAFRYMTGLKVCNKTWRIVIKFGWPVERCPRKIEFLPHFVKIIQKQTLQATPGVANPHTVGQADAHTKKGRGGKEGVNCEIQCEGSNLGWVAQLSDQYVDHSKISSNDIKAMFKFYGVECGRACVIGELARVFGVYGITVDFRHLSLIADAMTCSGEFRAFSRMGMSHHPSPLLQMSFETSIKFLTEGVERGAIDNLRGPAGALVVGRNTSLGTGCCRPLTCVRNLKKSLAAR